MRFINESISLLIRVLSKSKYNFYLLEMSQTKQVKDFYAILGVTPEANESQIGQAYNKLAVQFHPGKNTDDRLNAQKKFKDVCEAYKFLSDKNNKAQYDHLIKGQFTLQQAENTFEDFYHVFGVENEEEKQFFQENYPHLTKNYYHILGVQNHASLSQIQEAYRKLALKYHPKRNPEDEDAKKIFLQVNEAYNALSCDKKRQSYNDITFKSLQPIKAHDIFEEFFSERMFRTPEEEEFFRPMIQKRWIQKLDKIMNDDHHQSHHEGTEITKEHQVYQNKNGVQSKKTVKEHKIVKDGKVHHQITQEYTLPNGEKEVRKTIKDGDKVQKQVHRIKNEEASPFTIHASRSRQIQNSAEKSGQNPPPTENPIELECSKQVQTVEIEQVQTNKSILIE